MRFIRILAGVALFAIVISFVLIVILGRSVDRDRDTSLTSTTDPALAQLTPTVTQPGSDSVLIRGVVEHVSDGDTVRIRIGSTIETVRLIGIDAPEIASSYPADCLANDATDYLTRLIDGKAVYLEPDVNDRDQYGRLLRYIWLPKGDGYLLVNQLIVGKGLAVARIYDGDDKHAAELARTELDAITRGTGIWGSCLSSESHDVPGAPGDWDGRSDLDCADFATRVNAQAFYVAMGGPDRDPHNLDVDRNGLVCHTRPPTEPLD